MNNPKRLEKEDGKSFEVFTGEVVVINPQSEFGSLEALPVTCTIVIAINKEREIVGMAHCSLGSDNKEIIERLNQDLVINDTNLKESQVRVFNGDEMQWQEIEEALKNFDVEMPTVEYMEKEGIRLKRDGDIIFFSLLEEKE